jgi:hypothetical protein
MYQDYSSHEIKLAHEISDILSDRDSLSYHLQNARKYKEDFLRRILNKVMALSETKIKRSRAALYTYLINQSGHNGDTRH